MTEQAVGTTEQAGRQAESGVQQLQPELCGARGLEAAGRLERRGGFLVSAVEEQPASVLTRHPGSASRDLAVDQHPLQR